MAEHLCVIGGASLDVLHLPDQVVRSSGGAGLYTALAARRGGVAVTMIGPRPHPMPTELEAVDSTIDWQGETVSPDELPSFEIAHYGEGRSEMVSFRWGAEAELRPSGLPDDLPPGLVYCAPLCDPHLQLEFVRHFHSQGLPIACGTFERAVTQHPEIVRKILDDADVFFCNENEAQLLFGSLEKAQTSPGSFLYITCGPEGALVVQGAHKTRVPSRPVEEVDPTGAGDTFCGTVLARLILGEHPIQAARRGVRAAAEMVTAVGPTALLESQSRTESDLKPPVRIDPARIQSVGEVLKRDRSVSRFDFTGDDYPPAGDPKTLDFFFAATLQQFGFWTERANQYDQPMVAELDGVRRKGSDFLWAAYRRWLNEDPDGLRIEAQASLDSSRFDRRMRDDSDVNPLPAPQLHLDAARRYGQDMLSLGFDPESLVMTASRSSRPLDTFLRQLDHVGGYKEDPLRKKSALLAAILNARPEGFLVWDDDQSLPPIIDYHLQRSCLRIGLVEILDPQLSTRVSSRQVVESVSELEIRLASYEALTIMQHETGKPMSALDWFFFQNRQRCPEMTEPICSECPIESVCAQRKELFQPVLRTTFY